MDRTGFKVAIIAGRLNADSGVNNADLGAKASARVSRAANQ
ncbi:MULTISPECIES: hypothetical protein [Vibrio]|nr:MULTISPECIES: hypothetical protein [Vibrio]